MAVSFYLEVYSSRKGRNTMRRSAKRILSVACVCGALTAMVATSSCTPVENARRPVSPARAPQPASRPTQSSIIYTAWPFDSQEATKRQGETARVLGIPKELTLHLNDKVTMKLVLIPPGKFMMGRLPNPRDPQDPDRQHEVTITKPFYLGVFDVTRGQFAAFVEDAQYRTDAEKEGSASAFAHSPGDNDPDALWIWVETKGIAWNHVGFEQTDDHPVVCVSHPDAEAFCDWLSRKTGKKVQLPTDAQWEYACRAGTATNYQWGDKPEDGKGWCNLLDVTAQAKFSSMMGFEWADSFTYTSPVAKFKPNAFGLYDMHGNVWQWCADWQDRRYYETRPKTSDPQGPASGDSWVIRGGAWSEFNEARVRSDFRYGAIKGYRSTAIGFRVAIPLN